MKTDYKSILLAVLLPAVSCTEDNVPQEPEETDGGIAVAVAGYPESKADDADSYLHDAFFVDRSIIRVVNTVNYASPDFTDPDSYHDYIYTKEGVMWEDDEPNFFPLKAGSVYGDSDRVDMDAGIDDDKIVPTSNAFIFEAACYPIYYTPFDRVQADQSIEDGFLASDLLLAYTRKPLVDRYGLLKLRFWHVFSMIRIELKLPVAGPDDDNGFPQDDPDGLRTVTGVTLHDMYVTYNVRYTEAIDSYESRTVAATSDGGRNDILMYRLPYADGTEQGSDGTVYQTCRFAAIVPTQQIRTQETLLTMDIRTIVGLDEDGRQVVMEKTYAYTPSRPIDMVQGAITRLSLDAAADSAEPVLVDAEILPWNSSWSEVELLPEN